MLLWRAPFLTFHIEISLSMPLSKVPANMRVKSVHEETSQLDKSWLNEKAF